MIAALGFDPDLTKTAGALVTWDPEKSEISIPSLQLFQPPGKFKGQQACAAMCAALSVQARNWAISLKDFPVLIVVAEGQSIHRETKNWDSVTALGPVAGACVAATVPYVGTGDDQVTMSAAVPTPKEWTSGVPKHVRQARMWKNLGVPYEVRGSDRGRYAVPTQEEHLRGFNVGDWKHLGDAIGLALWGISQVTQHPRG